MTIKLTINDKEIEVPAGTTVLRAAQMAGIDMPVVRGRGRRGAYSSTLLYLAGKPGSGGADRYAQNT
jgi:hypothetical protein